ncbi:MAG: glycoside hydrolase [Clostridia bacterium]|nr:glycoside hydrolase [Clostridia bacterium]MBR0536793.1 glycoside hydrolase [Clostridia bacterium]
MKRFRFGTPEKQVPSLYCDGFSYTETACSYKQEDFSFRVLPTGCVIEWKVDPDTHFFGGGLQFYRVDHTGHRLGLRCAADPLTDSGETHAAVPFLATNKGYGFYVDTARSVEFHCGIVKPDAPEQPEGSDGPYVPALSTDALYRERKPEGTAYMTIFVPNCSGVDLYLFEGKTITDITAQYNMLSGGGCRVPDWGLGVVYRCNGTHTAGQILAVADYMKENRIPVDVIGLEPGWQTHAYPCTYVWNPERFPDPAGFIGNILGRGLHINLWEHAYVHPDCPVYGQLRPYSADYCVFNGIVPDFSVPEARGIFAGFQKHLTKLGIDGFKADECDNGEHTGGWGVPPFARFPSGLDGERYRNLFGTLYAKTMLEALDGAPTVSEIRSIGALAASYPFVLYSDLYDLKAFVCALVNAGFSGLLWAPEFRRAASRKEVLRRLQPLVFSPHCLINAWSNPEIPWLQFDCVDEVRSLLQEHERLIPMLKNAFNRYHDTGVPPVRALAMDWTDDPETYDIRDEYMLGDSLLVAPITSFDTDEREVYLPRGEWEDYYTGEPVAPGRFTVVTENIPVYRKK